MSFITTRPRMIALGAVCAAAGAGAGSIAVAGASTAHRTSSSKRSAHHARIAKDHRGLVRLARRTVHADLVVHTKSGFQTVTINRGTLDSVSGDTLTMTDGTRTAKDQQVTVTIPSSARVRNDRKASSLSSLTAGERVMVVQLPKRTVVVARAAASSAKAS